MWVACLLMPLALVCDVMTARRENGNQRQSGWARSDSSRRHLFGVAPGRLATRSACAEEWTSLPHLLCSLRRRDAGQTSRLSATTRRTTGKVKYFEERLPTSILIVGRWPPRWRQRIDGSSGGALPTAPAGLHHLGVVTRRGRAR